MGKIKAIQPRLLAALTLAGLVGLLGLGFWWPKSWWPWWPISPLGDGLVRASYDSLHYLGSAGAKSLSDSPVVIIYLDLHSYGQKGLDPAEPWPRDLHARLLQRLSTAGARTVVFDITFGAAGPNPAADEALAEALRENGRAILAAEFNNKISHALNEDQNWTRSHSVVPPYTPFAQAAAGWGVASLGIEDDLVVRHHLPAVGEEIQPTLTWATAGWLRLPVTQGASPLPAGRGRWIRYYGPALSIPHVSYSEALEPAGVPDEFFHDKIVFVGARPMENLFHERQDEFRSPFHSWRYKEYFVPGVEVHATQMLNLIRHDWLRTLSPGAELAWLLGCACLFGGGLVWLRPIPATATALSGAAVTLGLALYAFSRGVWFPWLIAAAAQIPTALAGAVLFHSVEWYRTRRRLEAAKRVADAKIREQAALIDKAHDAILVQDIGGCVLYANPSAERLYGWKLADLQSDGAVAELFSPDSAGAATARSAAIAQGEWNGELRQQTRAGQIVTVASRWTLIRDEAGQPKALLLINSDVTEQKQLEAQFLRTQRMNTIGTLAGGMAHDLNNALAPILMGVQLLRRKGGDEESSRLLGFMETNTNRGAEMVRQVLLFARGRGGEFQRLELGPLVKELEKMVRETFPKNIAVETFLPADLWPVRGNPTQLHQVLLNLCVNARDAMPAGGRLSFAADNVELTAAEAATIPEATPGPFVSLLVSDTGTGMTAEVRARIFEPFFTT
ncbi:MAG TPA: CHASE2 domain-containing protein, partial [Verrucomicrobiae bacterium]